MNLQYKIIVITVAFRVRQRMMIMCAYVVLNIWGLHSPLIGVEQFFILIFDLHNDENSVIKEHKDYHSKIVVF